VEAGLNSVAWLVGSYWFFFFFLMKGKWVKKVAVDSVYCGGGGGLCLRVWFSVM
jgi:hypothetical protein